MGDKSDGLALWHVDNDKVRGLAYGVIHEFLFPSVAKTLATSLTVIPFYLP
ncbi:hypothetical protein SG34_013525 [Thalassomonas viridans]|uniref:Uncharacterized protein n=1 Tax=Thalassomonas viridans TaxID=137584 RepID=A0AAE9Z6Q5_9GAMM|nr:hypothetical protein [Thalassomonas viridans]WDE07806.1 hypothetical protein SG34_013525 [Thalassomonas viridans]